jgi:hypothetical protein
VLLPALTLTAEDLIMQVKHLSEAYSISKQVAELHRARDMIAGGAGLGITIQSTYQDDTFIENIRPYVLDELDRRIAEKMNCSKRLASLLINSALQKQSNETLTVSS